jgi:hypothetical protein
VTSKNPDHTRYLTGIPRKPLPPGQVVVHNHIRHTPQTRSGERGFRFWRQDLTERLERCDCGWAPELKEHYHVRRDEHD